MDNKTVNVKPQNDRIEDDLIILDGNGKFPKKLIIRDQFGQRKEYRIVKTKNGGFILN